MESAIKYNPFIKSVLGKTKNRHLQVFLLGLGIATVFFIPFIVWDKGYFLFFGDFNVQQVPFYRHGVEAVHSGNIFWDWNTDLGANFIASYSFYNLGSPFFWIACLFPSSFAPYLMGPLLILKFACAGLTGYMFIRRFVKNQDFAVLGGLMYAFSGFSVYNIFFNHFHEAIVFFPLMLLGLELLMTEQKRGLFAATVFICAFSNYFFFVGMVVFVVIYWFLRMISGAWKLRVSDFFWMLGEAVAGVGMAAVLLVPSYIVVMQNPRVGNMLTGYSQLLYGKEQIFLNVIEVFFFPPDLPARPIFFPGADVKWSSLGGWLPLFGMTGVLAYFQTRRGTWLKRIISILIFMALVPLLNSAFYSLNSAYYARWFYMPVLMMSLATCVSLEDKRTNWTRALKWSIGVTVAFSLAIGFLPSHRDDELHPLFLGIMTHIKHFGLYSYNDKNPADSSNFTYMIRYWITCAIAIGSLAVLAILIPMLKTGRRKFANLAILCFSIITIAYSGFFIYSGKTHSYDTHNFIIPHLINQEEEMELPDKIGRVDVYNGMDNASMYLNMPGVQAFHSIVPQSIMDFYPYIGVERSVGSRPDTDHLGLRGLISVHWLLEYVGPPDNADKFAENGIPKLYGFEYYGKQNEFKIYENQYYIPYGFTYDYYMSGSTCETYGENRRELMMLKAILLEPEQIDRYGDVLRPFSESLEREPDEYGYAPTLDPNFDDDAYAADCMARKAAAAYYFSRDNSGFTSKINLPKANLVFYSVPYEEGWTATVDGEPVTVEKVNKGFMAVPVPAGDHTIRFNYATPGLKPGLWVSFGSLVLLVAYVLGFYFFKKGKPKVAYSAFGEDSGVARGVSNLERDDKNVSDRFYSGQLADAEYEFGIDPYQTSIAGAFYTPGQADGFPERVILEQTPPTHNNQDLPYYLPKNETIPETDTPSESETPDPEEGDLNVNKPTSTPNGVPIDYDYSFNFDNPEEK